MSINQDEVDSLITGIEKCQTRMSRCQGAQQLIIVAGPKGSGKSTLINGICRLHPNFIQGQQGGSQIIRLNNEMPQIRNSNLSRSHNPGRYRGRQEKILYYQAPSYSEAYATNQEIFHHYCLYRLFRIERLKIIIVIDNKTMNEDPQCLVDMINELQSIFISQFSKVINSCALVISKVNESQMSDTFSCFQQISNDTTEESQQKFQLISYLYKHNAIFPFLNLQQSNRSHIRHLRKSIKKLPPYKIRGKPFVSLSNTGEQVLLSSISYFRDRISKILQVMKSRLWSNLSIFNEWNSFSMDVFNRISVEFKRMRKRDIISILREAILQGHDIPLQMVNLEFLKITPSQINELRKITCVMNFVSQFAKDSWKYLVAYFLTQLEKLLRVFTDKLKLIQNHPPLSSGTAVRQGRWNVFDRQSHVGEHTQFFNDPNQPHQNSQDNSSISYHSLQSQTRNSFNTVPNNGSRRNSLDSLNQQHAPYRG